MATKTRLTGTILLAFILVAIDWTQLMQLMVAGHMELEGNALARIIGQAGVNGLFLFAVARLLAFYEIWRLAVIFPRLSTFLYILVVVHVAVIANNALALAILRG